MKHRILLTVLIIAFGLTSCTNPNNKETEPQKENATTTQKIKNMNNLISIVEIPTADFSRAVTFYESVMGISIEKMEMDGNQMGILPSDEGTVNVVLVNGTDYKPTTDGAVLYLSAGNDLQPTLEKVTQNGGQVIVPKTAISPEMGYFALFIDSEGNKLGLHSTN